MIKDKESLIYKIKLAVAEYCYDHDDNDFYIVVSVSANDGWVKAEIKED